ncbi:conserved hypothetical protein [Verrucomicrobia bacterium]|nr:conserved hypothetical protein [Verrucomicrobiota bacterium]
MSEVPQDFRRLDADKIIETVTRLQGRIERRFPGSGLGKVVADLRGVAQETAARLDWIQRPHLVLRSIAILLTLGIIALVITLLRHIRQFQFDDFTNSVQALDSSIGSVVFIGAAILFFVNWEHRIKRDRALKAIHELRALAHIVDMHQLTKDPESYFARSAPPGSVQKRALTPFELNRYLDYCSEALALVSKIAALHVQRFTDSVLLDAVDDVEDLTAGLSRKIWQKITILENLGRSLRDTQVAQGVPERDTP